MKMTKAEKILENIRETGGLDWGYISYAARCDGVSEYRYLYNYIKGSYGCHGNTARVVVRELLY